jgi:glyoxalase/bleomycin resistance protein/dioxygenase superfamily protein
MLDINFVLLYVESPAASAAFYEKLLGRPPVEASATFALFAMPSGVMLGLWSRHTVEPAPTAKGGGGEIAVTVADAAAVDATHADWSARSPDIAGTDGPGFRPHVRRPRPRWASAARLFSSGAMSRSGVGRQRAMLAP